MLQVSDIIKEIRNRTHDEQETGYTDETLISYINDGIRFIRRTIFGINPLLLADFVQQGTLAVGQKNIQLAENIIDENGDEQELIIKIARICSVRVDGYGLEQINPADIYDINHTGKPKFYYLTGFSTINLFPATDVAYDYEITAVKDISLLTTTDDISPLPTEMDDWLYEYATIRASDTNEYDVSQESTIFGQIVAQIENMCYQLSPVGVTSNGYWDSNYKTSDAYAGRRRYR